jgi:hypothetical protein
VHCCSPLQPNHHLSLSLSLSLSVCVYYISSNTQQLDFYSRNGEVEGMCLGSRIVKLAMLFMFFSHMNLGNESISE